MRTYIVADTTESIARNRGVEIMASSFEEARDKAESLGVPCRLDASCGGGYTWGDSFYAITDGETTRDIECEFVSEAQISIGCENHEEIPLL